MNKQIDKNELFYKTYLGTSDSPFQAIVTGLGLATIRVVNEKLLDKIKQIAKMDEVEGEFSFIRNTHLHYKLSNHFGVFSHGVLTFRACKTGGISRIEQFIVEVDGIGDVYRIKPFCKPNIFSMVGQKPTNEDDWVDLAIIIGSVLQWVEE